MLATSPVRWFHGMKKYGVLAYPEWGTALPLSQCCDSCGYRTPQRFGCRRALGGGSRDVWNRARQVAPDWSPTGSLVACEEVRVAQWRGIQCEGIPAK